MPITRLNHAVLFVRDAERSAAFYTDVLEFKVRSQMTMGGGPAYFLVAPGSDNDHDLGLFSIGAQAAPSRAGASTRGHVPPGVAGRHPRRARAAPAVLTEAGALVGSQ